MTSVIHPTAVVDPSAELGDDVQIGPHAVVEGETRIGDGCRLAAGAIIRRWTTLGAGNTVDSHAVLGGDPQDHGHDPSVRSFLQIGGGNVFREGCTISRATGEDKATIIGDDNYFMTCVHVGHNCTVGSNCIMTNGSVLGGYVELGNRAILSANVGAHQFCWIGEGVMSRGNSSVTAHIPPYCMLFGMGCVRGLNNVGLRRTPGVTVEDRRQVRHAYDLLYRRGLSAKAAMAEMDACSDWGKPAATFRAFVRRVFEAPKPYNRGVCRDITRERR